MKMYAGLAVQLYNFLAVVKTLFLHLRENSDRYPLYRRLRRLQSRYGSYGEEKNLLPLPEI
jgi:hypothetical protein